MHGYLQEYNITFMLKEYMEITIKLNITIFIILFYHILSVKLSLSICYLFILLYNLYMGAIHGICEFDCVLANAIY